MGGSTEPSSERAYGDRRAMQAPAAPARPAPALTPRLAAEALEKILETLLRLPPIQILQQRPRHHAHRRRRGRPRDLGLDLPAPVIHRHVEIHSPRRERVLARDE